jgi:sigma-B regulation protein RsbU (phosphoserine phosphatase)
MQHKETNKEIRWSRLKNFIRAHTGIIVIIVAALMLELTSGIMYIVSHNILHRMVERLMERENNALYLCIRNKLAEVEVTLDNIAWVVTDDLENPDSLTRATYQMAEHNPAILGCCIACIPDYFPQKGHWFEPYSIRQADGSIETMQLGSARHDYTKMEFFTAPITTGSSHWSEPYLDRDGAKAVVTSYSAPVRDADGKIVAVISADISLGWLYDEINQSKVYKSTQRFLVTGQYNLLAGDDNQLLKIVLEHLRSNGNKKGNVELKDEHGHTKHVFYTPVGGKTNWLLINALDDTDVYGKLHRVRLNLFLMALAGLLLISFIVWRSKRNLERLNKVNAEKNRISSELHVASQIQQSMLPRNDLKQADVDVFGSLVPAREVGGDLYDYFIRDEKLFFCIGDVSGKGVPSAMVMTVNHALFLSASAHETNPARILEALNEIACQGNESNMFVTIFVGVLDLPTGHLRYCNAGHDAPFVMVNGQWSMVDADPHLPIGVFDDVKYGMTETYMQPGSTLFLYTDGLTEAKNSERKLFGIQRVEEVLATCTNKHSQALLESISEAVHGFVGDAEQSDDLTMLAIRYTPQQYHSTLHEKLTLKNDVREVTKLSSFQKSFYEKMNLDKSLARQLRLAVEEAVVNVIEYAYLAGTEGTVEITMMSDGHRLKVLIDDSGIAFDPTAEKKVDTTLSVEERRVGGLGIHLVRELMDSINYERINGHNILTLIKQINM